MSTNKTILITGASKNLGDYLKKYYLEKKFNVIGVSKSLELSSTRNFYTCDLSSAKKTRSLFIKLKKKFKNIDLIISCAGTSKKTYKIKENLQDWKYAFNNNFYSFSNLLDSYLYVYKYKPTKIIVISTIASVKITNAPITYSVAKSALNYYVQFKAKELAKNDVKINIILPGNILMKKNNWAQKIKRNNKKIKKYIKENVPLNRFCSPVQISGICDYLLSNAGDNITGSKFIIDGGESL
jgi:NAD(P)-dependent dehydrogenase (short-subunit alcohol dehydrogenase family)